MHAKLRLAVIGAGKHGSRYATHAAKDVEGVELVAVCRRNAAAGSTLAGELGCAFEADAEKLLARRDVDAFVLAVPPSLLPRLVRLATQARKILVVEKPVATTVREGLAMLHDIESSGVYCIPGHTLRFNTTVQLLARELPSLGRLDSLLFSQRFSPQPQLVWLDTPGESGGGNVLHTGVHCYDLLRWLSGTEVKAVAAQARSVCTKNTEDHFVAALEMDKTGLLAQVACSRSTRSRNGLIEATGENGQIVVDHVTAHGYRLGPRGREELELPPPSMTTKSLLERVVEDAGRNAPPPLTYRDGLAAVAVAEATYRSLASRRFEDVERIVARGAA